ncbi:MAG TPA: hypothetical protein VGR95_23355 [Thermoanaerobaculia bacterium]|jgi:hypothetical protein|nr:hypothetical protein [Thermoanaerobaculia bacterium]
MPGPYVHIAVAENVRDAMAKLDSWAHGASTATLPDLPGRTPAELARIAADHPSYYALGAIGPDLFFFLPDFRTICVFGGHIPLANPAIRIVETLDNLYASLDGWILSRMEYYFGPFSENIDEALSRMTGDLTSVVQDVLGGLSSICTNLILDIGSQIYDWFGLFSLGLNKGYDNQDFFWSDMLHYRRTSQYARSLWIRAERIQSDALRAYALGYMTHLGTDTAGHPFVNEKSGGPYRLHWQRHHLVENHMDSQTYDVDFGSSALYKQFVESALHYKIAFEDDGSDSSKTLPSHRDGDESLRGLYRWRRQLDLDSTMPAALAALLIDGMSETYSTSTPPNPANASTSSPRIIPTADGRPLPETVRDAYVSLFRYLKMSTLDGFRHEKPKPPEVFPNIAWPQLTDPHDEPPDADHSLPVVDSILKIVRFSLYLVSIAIWFATIIQGILLDLATYVPRLIAYYALELPIYYILKAERRVLVMSGFLHPMTDEIDIGLVKISTGHDDGFLAALHCMDDVLGGFGDDLIGTIITEVQQLSAGGASVQDVLAQILGGFSVTFSEPPPNSHYPHAHVTNSHGQSIEHHAPWQYPASPTELGATFAGPYQSGDMPHVLLDGAQPGNQSIRTQFENAPSPMVTNSIAANVTAADHLGDPVNFSAYLIRQLTRDQLPPIADWNLDADRGYAYKCWDWNRHEQDPAGGGPFLLRDKDGHLYMEPCTPPPQQDQPNDLNKACGPFPIDKPNPDVPLKLHWADLHDPHCSEAPQLAAFLQSWHGIGAVVTVTLGIANSGSVAANNVQITAVGAIGATGAAYQFAGSTPINVAPSLSGLTVVSVNLSFNETSGSPGAPFHFDVTLTATGVTPVTTTIQVL